MENRRVALVTGASRGIGRAIATRLASSNIDIVINYNKDLEGAEETQKQCEKLESKLGYSKEIWVRKKMLT